MQEYRNTNITRRHAITKAKALVTIAVCGSLLSGCGLLQKFGILSKPEAPAIEAPAPKPLSEQPYELHLGLMASADLNPDSQLRPSPVQVRVFVMEPQADINTMGFEEMFDYAGNLMEPRPSSSVTIRPGQTMDIVIPANQSQSMLVIAAAFRDPYQSLWKAITTITPADTVAVTASIGATTVAINPSP